MITLISILGYTWKQIFNITVVNRKCGGLMLPLVLGAIAIGSALLGGAKAVEGFDNMHTAEKIGKEAQERYEQAVKKYKADLAETNNLAARYGELQISIYTKTLRRVIALIERIGNRVGRGEKQFLQGFEVATQQVKQYKQEVLQAENLGMGLLKSGLAASAGYGGALSLATSVGVASTGAAISGLSGAAATNATLAWLGGGAIAAGGGGMALGSLVLGGITVGPALAIGGFLLAGEGEKALTNAKAYEAKVNVALEQISAIRNVFIQVQKRINELQGLVTNLSGRVDALLDEFERQDFNPTRDAKKFQNMMLLVKALSEILKTPVLDEEGNINPQSATIYAKYRSL